ncbi:hypothetical protein BDZ45DRAFT_180944 [Acephala macrosclerotiorum]|nr:hypothetical protein BDZ45DRAFT_180944 [Acephala macrosclerotiorum]
MRAERGSESFPPDAAKKRQSKVSESREHSCRHEPRSLASLDYGPAQVSGMKPSKHSLLATQCTRYLGHSKVRFGNIPLRESETPPNYRQCHQNSRPRHPTCHSTQGRCCQSKRKIQADDIDGEDDDARYIIPKCPTSEAGHEDKNAASNGPRKKLLVRKKVVGVKVCKI